MKYEEIKASVKSGEERLSVNGKLTSFSLLDFWKWSTSDLISNATRGKFAEFVVATAIGVDLNIVRDEWADYDLISQEEIKIEVKSASYIQSWEQDKLSNISFSIKKNIRNNLSIRYADVYIFCLLKHIDQKTINPLETNQWDFYVVSTNVLNNYKRSQTSITLNSIVNRLNIPSTSYTGLREAIKQAYINNNLTHPTPQS